METVQQTRRRFIAALITVPLIAAGLWRFLTPKQVKKQALLRVPQADIPIGGALIYKQERIALIRQGEQVIALSLVCTHLGCTVTVTPEGMVCPCHGSRFDRQGKVLTGPAERPLPSLMVETEGDLLVVRG